jgi:ABC-type lipopolysaccharide export system ATPase subunit
MSDSEIIISIKGSIEAIKQSIAQEQDEARKAKLRNLLTEFETELIASSVAESALTEGGRRRRHKKSRKARKSKKSRKSKKN